MIEAKPVGIRLLEEEHDNPDGIVIRAANRAQARDWALVLESQQVECVIVRQKGGPGWGILVDERDADIAEKQIGLFQKENKGWNWREQAATQGGFTHPAAIVWLVALAMLHVLAEVPSSRLKELGMMDVRAYEAGQWWRLFTAVTLHGDWTHLISNFVSGVFFLGMACVRFGPGAALLGCFFAGAFGNLLGSWFYEPFHRSLGASGMILGGLGMMSVESIRYWKGHPKGWKRLAACIAAAVMLLLLFGAGERTDHIAHMGGFLGGAMIAVPLSLIRQERLTESAWQMVSASVLVALVYVTWLAAMASGG